MSTLSFRSQQVTIAGDVSKALRFILIEEFVGFTSRLDGGYIFAEKNGCLVDLLVLQSSGTLYWAVMLCVGPTQAAADAILDEVSQIVSKWL